MRTVYPMILAQRKPPESEKTFGEITIFLPDDQYFDNREMEVIAIHNGKPGEGTDKPGFKTGDTILVRNFDTEPIKDVDRPGLERLDMKYVLAKKQDGKIKPVGEMVLVKPVREEISAGGIIIPETAIDNSVNSRRGEILAVGDSPKIEARVGQVVVFRELLGTELSDKSILLENDELDGIIEDG